jgi:hypothetical protein
MIETIIISTLLGFIGGALASIIVPHKNNKDTKDNIIRIHGIFIS